MKVGSMTQDEVSLRIDAMNRRLNSRCKGFLETDRAFQNIQGNSVRHPSQLTVQYLHRTVRDFIKSPKAQEFLQTSTNPNFDPSIQLCAAYLMSMKRWSGPLIPIVVDSPIQPYTPPNKQHLIAENTRALRDKRFLIDGDEEECPSSDNAILCLRQAACVIKPNRGAMIALLDELKYIISRPEYRDLLVKDFTDFRDRQSYAHTPAMLPRRGVQGRCRFISNFRDNVTLGLEDFAVLPDDESFLSLAVRYDIVPYVIARAGWGGLVRRLGPEKSEERFPLLLDALSGDVPEPEMVKCLLDLGADPNYKMSNVNSQTPWLVALTKVTLLYTLQNSLGDSTEYFVAENKWKQTLKLMFSRGADCTRVPNSLLSPISRKILQDVKNEVDSSAQGRSSLSNWFGAWNLR